MTKLLEDIFNEPRELSRSLAYSFGQGKPAFEDAVELVKAAAHVCVIGMGSSWNAGSAVLSILQAKGRSAVLYDASELLHFADVPEDSAAIVLSRSGKSTEIVQMLGRLRTRGAKIIALTNTPDSPLAEQADVVLHLNAAFDHQVSISMYSALAMTGGLLAAASLGELGEDLMDLMERASSETSQSIEQWRGLISRSEWLDPAAPAYFLGRGASLATCHEARLLWEESAKRPASAMPTGGFRHGPQEIVRPGLRVAMWIDKERMRAQDLALAKDLRHYGAQVLLIGQELREDEGDLVLNLPNIPAQWQFVFEIVPVQLTAERLAHLGSENCDAFRICSYIVEEEGGLIPDAKRSGSTGRAEGTVR